MFEVSFSRYEAGAALSVLSERGLLRGRRVERKAGSGRDFVVNADGTVSPMHGPSFVLGVSPPKLALVRAGSPRALAFATPLLSALAAGDRGLRLVTACGRWAVVPAYAAPRNAFLGWRFLELAVGEPSAALPLHWQAGFLVSQDPSSYDMVFDVGNLGGEVAEGTALVLAGGATARETMKPAARRRWAIDVANGTLGLEGHPDLVLGIEFLAPPERTAPVGAAEEAAPASVDT